MANRCVFVEIGSDNIFFRSYTQPCGTAVCLPVDNGILWNAKKIAALIEKQLSRRRVFILLNTPHTLIRLGNKDFPFDGNFRDTDFICSHSAVGEVLFSVAIPVEISGSLAEACRLNNVRPASIRQIDVIEHRLALYYSARLSDAWVILPQKSPDSENSRSGIRIISFSSGSLYGVYFISNDPEFRVRELSRIWLSLSARPERVIFLSAGNSLRRANYINADEVCRSENGNTDFLSESKNTGTETGSQPEYDWINSFFDERSVEYAIENHGAVMDAVVREWFEALEAVSNTRNAGLARRFFAN